ncbi:MAG: methyltransferase domain-containing protein [Ferruginibacter sp.]
MTVNEACALIITDRIRQDAGISRWADLGCGEGLFTVALSRMLTEGSIIYGIDKKSLIKSRVTGNGVKIIARKLDFVNDDLVLQNLDGILLANSIHYVKDKLGFIGKMKLCLKPLAHFLIVEYDIEVPVAVWVPYPLSFLSMTRLFKSAGFNQIKKLGERSSVYGNRNIYSALIGK